ncbi:discoidin domain-containing protein, partial [Streptomyces sp. NPDC005009]
MRRSHPSKRWGAGLLIAGLVSVGLLPVPAQAAAETNLALGRTATAGGATGGYPASNVTDGSQQSYWEGPPGSFPQWVQVGLGTQVDLDRLTLKLPTGWEARTQSLAILGSADGTAFNTITAAEARSFAPSAANTVNIDLPSATARYVRVQVGSNTTWNAAQLSELEVYGEAEGGEDPDDPPVTGTNLARDKPIEATSTTQNYVAGNANDDSTATYWESAGFPASLTVKLGSDADVQAVVVKLNPDSAWGPRTQSLEVLGRASDATGFTSLKARANYAFSPSAGQNTITIPVTGRVSDLR